MSRTVGRTICWRLYAPLAVIGCSIALPRPATPEPSRLWQGQAASPVAQSPTTPVPEPSFEAKLKKVVHDSTLANGLHVIAIENHSVPLVTVIVAVKTGAFTQEPGQEGVPHLFEHMLFKSFKADGMVWGQAMGELDIAGYNGFTGDEVVRYYITLPSEKVEGGKKALAELVRDPDFTDEDLVEERRVVIDELNRDESSPVRQLRSDVDQRLWTTAYGRKDPGGDAQALSKVTVKQLKEIFKRYYVPNNTALIVSGDVTAERAFKLANERFGHWPRQGDPFSGHPFVTPPLLAKSAGVINEQQHLEDVLVMIQWQGPSTLGDEPGTYAADVLSSILDEPGSTFQRHLVDSGLFASCSISYLTRANVGPITLLAHTNIDSLPHALNALSAEIAGLGSARAFSDDELESARNGRRVGMALDLEDQSSVGEEIAEFWASSGLGYFLTYSDRLGAVDRAQITTYANRYISHAPMVIGILSPPATGKAIQPAVVGFLNPPTQ